MKGSYDSHSYETSSSDFSTYIPQESNGWVDMGKGSLGLYRQHDNAGKRWLAVRNLTGKVMFSAGVVPQMNFTAMDKAGSVVFACRPVFGACVCLLPPGAVCVRTSTHRPSAG